MEEQFHLEDASADGLEQTLSTAQVFAVSSLICLPSHVGRFSVNRHPVVRGISV